MEEGKNMELRSEEVREILGTPPNWLIRRGMLVISLVILGLLVLCWFFRYPDIIRARVVIHSQNPPYTVFSKATGKLDHLLVTDHQPVRKGELLGIIENPADYEDVYQLMNQLDSVSKNLSTQEFLSEVVLNGDYHLGQVQSYYTAFITSLDEYINTQKFNIYEEKALSLKRQAIDLEKYLQQLISQVGILDKKVVISRRQLSRDSLLFQQKAISETDLEKSRSEFLNHELNHRTAAATVVNTRMQLSQVHRQISEFQTQKSMQQNELFSTLKEKFENLMNQLRVWEQVYVLKTPVSGRVTFNNVWTANQQIVEGTAVFSVVPDDDQELVGRILLPISGSGKVKINQKVNIKLDNYPYLEFGMLQGRITNISLVPVASDKGDYYTALVLLNQGLVTNYNRTLPFSQEMQGTAEIITENRRLLVRMVAPLVSLYRERMLNN